MIRDAGMYWDLTEKSLVAGLEKCISAHRMVKACIYNKNLYVCVTSRRESDREQRLRKYLINISQTKRWSPILIPT
ncbi:hypothetical protein M407DRAFT_169665 [Tulasnella calospora MUT 4182]|uniref:Uncharacterized protein n=1 Tax=Tulasnella calospora MUT 4182 TaxID=1051891 RepID=A0A0C3M6X8_9AGAM|nr:hypothetical protein M407DRAFT_169665 [Tulasnella calospora MUT 4182]